MFGDWENITTTIPLEGTELSLQSGTRSKDGDIAWIFKVVRGEEEIYSQTFTKVLLVGEVPEATEILDKMLFRLNPKKYKIEISDLRIALKSLIEAAAPLVKKLTKD